LRNFFKKGIIYLLLFAVTINSFPIYVLANMLTESKFKELAEEKLDISDEVRVVNEIEEKRTENEKHYLMSDGGVGVSTSAIKNTLKYPNQVIYQSNGAIKILGPQSVVVTNSNGQIITAWATSSKYYRK
jgi:hypothetical protein